MAAKRPYKVRPSPARKLMRRIVRLILWPIVIFSLIIVGLSVLYRDVSPPLSALMIWRMPGGVETDYRWRPISKISRNLALAAIASEDARFCQHKGVDWLAVEDVWEKMKGRPNTKPRGASTISMQVARNLFLWPHRSYVRKALEIPIAYMIDALWTKRRMIEIYLNIAEWGPGVYGAEAASRLHFNRSAGRISRNQAALLVAALPNPLGRNPGKPSRKLRRRAARIQKRLSSASSYTACIAANYAH